MFKILVISFLIVSSNAISQSDTLFEENMRRIGDLLFQELDEDFYGTSLLNRSFSSESIILEQIKGNYSQVHSVYDFLAVYQDVALSYADSNYMMNNETFANHVETIFAQNELSAEEDQLIQPFGLVYHSLSMIDTAQFKEDNFAIDNYSYIPLISEDQLYSKTLIKSGALLEFYPESGYEEGSIKYTPSLISHSPDIENMNLRINVGNGFENFNQSNSIITYARTRDSLIGQIAISFEKAGEIKKDTLQFYLTTKGELRGDAATKAIDTWDWTGSFDRFEDITYQYGVRTGCGNVDEKLKRPIILVAPYRPTIQPFSLKKYFKQFNFKSLISSLSDMGYDVIFIKQFPGNASLEKAGETLAGFIRYVNDKKENDYLEESWENTVIGFSMGGQIARYALKLMEYQHMLPGSSREHPHTRLYIPYDSPHLGANIPMFAQAVYKDLKNSSIVAHLAYNSLVDEASKDMSASHIIAAPPSISHVGSMKVLTYQPAPTSERVAFVDALTNNFNHAFTPLNDLRISYPTFSRNIAFSTGKNNQDYIEEFTLNPGKLLFSQNFLDFITIGGLKYKNRKLYASKYVADHTVFRNEVELLALLIPISIKNHDYRMNYALEWDMSQGGYKDEFYDKFPTGATPVLRLNASGFGQKFYDNHMNFLPLVSALGINPTIWQNNNLFFDLREEGLMFQKFDFDPIDDRSELFGYPHLAYPTNHFNITPFEAVYADPQTYEHIKMQKSAEADQLNQDYLVHTRDFVLDEVEADVVALQNKIIGENHNQGLANYKYKAWYKAYQRIEIGNKVTPKTNPGDYIIEKTGDITVYAGKTVSIQPGFHAQAGSNFHAFIAFDGCSRPREEGKSLNENNDTIAESNQERSIQEQEALELITHPLSNDIVIYPNPNNGSCVVKVPEEQIGGSYAIVNTNGTIIQSGVFQEEREKIFDLPNGIYYFQWRYAEEFTIKKIIVI